MDNNFDTVIQGQIYRSAQPNISNLKYYKSKYHINSILNLRGNNQKSIWYKNEILFSKNNHIKHYDLKLKAYKLPSKNTIKKLIYIIQNSPKPLLIHCRSGVDRTGLAAAIAKVLHDKSEDDIQDQISWQYNALSYKTVGYQFMENYFSFLKLSHKNDSRKSFLNWINNKSTQLHSKYGYFIT